MPTATARFFDAMAPRYEVLEPWYEHLYAVLHAILREALAPAAGPGPAPRALDAGCGSGFQAALLAGLGYRTHGADLSAGLLALARRRRPAAALAQADLEALPYGDAAFDAAACCGSTLSLVARPARALAELARVLRPGGRLLLECEHRFSPDLAWTLADSLLGGPLGYGLTRRQAWRLLAAPRTASVVTPYPGYPPLRLFTRPGLAALLRAAGLVPVRWWGLHAATNLIPSPLLHRPRVPWGLGGLYRGLRRLDAALASRAPGRGLGASLVVLAVRDAADARPGAAVSRVTAR